MANDQILKKVIGLGDFDITKVDQYIAKIIPHAHDMGRVCQQWILVSMNTNEDYLDGIIRVYNNVL
ncbi:MAG TPA: hypothetical protein DCX18_05035 [Erysipelotrichaceae bacterium]|nr:hypothetical protein [Erysipelotrichaceae bacterium]